MGILSGRETREGYRPSLLHRLFRGRVSGNAINGLGETRRRRPTPVYHDQRRWHPWRIVQEGFYLRVSLRGFWRYVVEAQRIDRETPAPIAPARVEDSAAGWAARIKEKARELGADAVGVARVDPEWVFEGDADVREPWIIMLGSRMDYEVLNEATKRRFSVAMRTVMETYNRGHRTAHRLADWIRAQGWDARGYGSPMRTPINMIPAAIEAGLGELGKHGSLIHRELGATFRLAYVLTGLPLVPDSRDEFGVDDFCMSCQLCTKECPPAAIVDQKQLVRGVEKWYVDFDRCVPYFNERFGCGICLAVCPWSRPGVAQKLSIKMVERRRDHPASAVPSGDLTRRTGGSALTFEPTPAGVTRFPQGPR